MQGKGNTELEREIQIISQEGTERRESKKEGNGKKRVILEGLKGFKGQPKPFKYYTHTNTNTTTEGWKRNYGKIV